MKVVRGKILKNMIEISYNHEKHMFNLFLFSNYIFFLRKTGSLTQITFVSSSWNRTSCLFPLKGLSANNTRFMEY